MKIPDVSNSCYGNPQAVEEQVWPDLGMGFHGSAASPFWGTIMMVGRWAQGTRGLTQPPRGTGPQDSELQGTCSRLGSPRHLASTLLRRPLGLSKG